MIHRRLWASDNLRPWLIVAVAVALVPCPGCGGNTPEVAPVEGKVLISGQPLTTGRIITTPAAGRGATGYIQQDGTFELSTYGEGDGALLGTHSVAVLAYEGTPSGPEGGARKLLVPERYINDMTSGLTIEVKADEDNVPVIELTSP